MSTRRRATGSRKPPLTIDQILAWADHFHSLSGHWPNRKCGRIPDSGGETWSAVDGALVQGNRGLPRGGSLLKLLAEHRGYRHRNYLPDLSVDQILAWADAHRARTGEWPDPDFDEVADAPGETWNGIRLALERGKRGLPTTTLRDLLAEHRGRPHAWEKTDLTEGQILAWAEEHHARTGLWPTLYAGPVGSTGEVWLALDHALRDGYRGLPGGSSLFLLLKNAGKVTGDFTPHLRKRRKDAVDPDAPDFGIVAPQAPPPS
jgi:hypothetical protein